MAQLNSLPCGNSCLPTRFLSSIVSPCEFALIIPCVAPAPCHLRSLSSFLISVSCRTREQVLEDERSSGVEIHGRIGLTIGPSVCGVVGALQPRFCVAGKVVSEVAELVS